MGVGDKGVGLVGGGMRSVRGSRREKIHDSHPNKP